MKERKIGEQVLEVLGAYPAVTRAVCCPVGSHQGRGIVKIGPQLGHALGYFAERQVVLTSRVQSQKDLVN